MTTSDELKLKSIPLPLTEGTSTGFEMDFGRNGTRKYFPHNAHYTQDLELRYFPSFSPVVLYTHKEIPDGPET